MTATATSSGIDQSDYLAALTRELDEPGKGHLDIYLKPLIRDAVALDGLAANVSSAPGLGGQDEDVILGDIADVTLKAQYDAQDMTRKAAQE
ncbi:hypothetical protein [Tardiphaga sp. 367_B4_N1_1]|uniref:hypothetical protein n=1 Tax=Tardiphaga sp. 367_B4_N1_1 TaxID=3240777 RepID=UPI003F290A6B